MRISTLILMLATVLAIPVAGQAGEQRIPPANGGYTEFMLPSGNIGCIYIPKGGTDVYQPEDGGPELQCDRIEPSYMRAILGASGKGKTHKNVGDASCCSGPVLRYGNTVTLGPYFCESERTGLTCYRDNNGIFLSRRKINVW